MKKLCHIMGIVILLCISSLEMHAQVTCSNKLLSDIVEQLSAFQATDHWVGEKVIPGISPHKPIVMERNSKGVVHHVGIKFFNRAVMDKHPSPIYYFIERYFLELLLLPGQEEIANKLKMERVHISSEVYSLVALKKGLQDIVAAVEEDFSVYITSNNNRYSASCLNGNQLLVKVSFPVRNELITGFTKLEAENSIYPSLLLYKQPKQKAIHQEYLTPYKDNLYCANEDSYVTDDIVSTSYYLKKEGTYRPVFTSAHLEESVYNLFNSGADWGITAEVVQDLYGGKKNAFEIPLAKLTHFMQDNQCTLYTGIRKYDKKVIEGIVVAVNTELGYQHIMVFTFDKGILELPKSHKVHIKMYSYVPIHNVSSLF